MSGMTDRELSNHLESANEHLIGGAAHHEIIKLAVARLRESQPKDGEGQAVALDFNTLRAANVARCEKWHPAGIGSWSPSDWMVALAGEVGELAGEVKMHNRDRDGLAGNKEQITETERLHRMGNEAADVAIYLDLFCAERGIDLGAAIVRKFNEVSVRVGFPDRLNVAALSTQPAPSAPVVDDRFPGGFADAIAYADAMEESAGALYAVVFGNEDDGSNTGAELIEKSIAELSAPSEQVAASVAVPEANDDA